MDTAIQVRKPWNKGLIVGQKRPLLPRQVWSIRVRLEISASARDLALFKLAIDSKLRASDLVRLSEYRFQRTRAQWPGARHLDQCEHLR
jgi:hypothetical protein